MALLYSLLSRVPSKQHGLSELVEEHIKQHAGEAISQRAVQLATDPRAFVTALLDIYDRYGKLIQGAFRNEPGFTKAMDKVRIFQSL